MSKVCPHCHSTTIVKFGTRNGRQRYRCKTCSKTWQNNPQPQRMEAAIWKSYAVEDLRIKQLGKKYHLGDDKIRGILTRHQVPPITPSGEHDVIGMDCTYFGRRGIDEWGLLIVVDLHSGECLYCGEIPGHETYAHYCTALDVLAGFGVYPKACVIDGVVGLAGVLERRGLLVQYCQFHQIKTVNSYLTRNPVLEPNIELRKIALSLASSLLLTLGSTNTKYGSKRRLEILILVNWNTRIKRLGVPCIVSKETFLISIPSNNIPNSIYLILTICLKASIVPSNTNLTIIAELKEP